MLVSCLVASLELVTLLRHGGISTSFKMGVAMFGNDEFAVKMPVAHTMLHGGLACAGLI